MLIQCPKCGFDQPKDTYCAKCGIEMERYEPQKPSLYKRVVSSPLYYLFLLIALSFGTYKGCKKLQDSDSINFKKISDRISGFNSNSERNGGETDSHEKAKNPYLQPRNSNPVTPANDKPSASSPTNPSSPPPQNAETNSPSPSPPEGVAEEPLTAQTPPPATPTEGTDGDGAATVNPALIKGPLQLEVYYFEVPSVAIQQFFNEASEDSKGDSGEMSYGIVKNGNRWFKQMAFRSLDKITKPVAGLKKKILWYSGTTEPTTGAPFGFNFQVTLSERQAGHLTGDVSISRAFVEFGEGGPTSVRKEFYTQFETEVGSAIGITGIMPHTAPKVEEKDWLQESLLKAYLSPSYLSQETELLILLHFKSDSK